MKKNLLALPRRSPRAPWENPSAATLRASSFPSSPRRRRWARAAAGILLLSLLHSWAAGGGGLLWRGRGRGFGLWRRGQAVRRCCGASRSAPGYGSGGRLGLCLDPVRLVPGCLGCYSRLKCSRRSWGGLPAAAWMARAHRASWSRERAWLSGGGAFGGGVSAVLHIGSLRRGLRVPWPGDPEVVGRQLQTAALLTGVEAGLRFGIRYGKRRLNVERTKCMQEIVCDCSGVPKRSNTRSCRCRCPAMIWLLRSKDNSW
ncbi:uncharacterized protein [Triticum aestivum]|nr:uncharacterized protein LOC123157900 isoform X4 [Triticum aestivum]XP_044432030.1 uncharacterized protein LOC123157900 isoform X4 [Triticum aestivum]